MPFGLFIAANNASQAALRDWPVITFCRLPPDGPLLGNFVSFIASFTCVGLSPKGRRVSCT